jgi:NhaP-type Na+/H+ or K+/H+ antiporter
LGLSDGGIGGGPEKLIPITFVVIVATALIYGLSGAPVAKALGVSRTGPGGVLIVGASRVARATARALNERGVAAVIWTGNHELGPRSGRTTETGPGDDLIGLAGPPH